MKHRTGTATAALLFAIAFSGVAAASTGKYAGSVQGQTTSKVGLSVRLNGKGQPTKVKSFTFSGVTGHCPDVPSATLHMNGAFHNLPVTKQSGKFVFTGAIDEPGKQSNVTGTFSSNRKKVSGELDDSETFEGLGTCSFESAAYSAKKS